MGLLALSAAAETTVIASAMGGVVLAGLIGFGVWWFRPFRSQREDRAVLDRREREQRMRRDD